jgi:uncharacterized glyoxalase superfamily protein PhnB/GNAT superfamily N-acetyltransferase
VIREREPADAAAVDAFLARHNSVRVARRGTIENVRPHPMLLAEADGRLMGLLTYVPEPPRCEVLTLHVEEQWRGLGTALIDAVAARARAAGCTALWLVTTNDNVDALRFYQRRGFRLVALNAGAVDDSRARLKPEIPPLGDYGIPLRDELELELQLGECGSAALRSSITPVLTVRGAAEAATFYARAFGAEEIHRNAYPDGRIVAELAVGHARFRVADEAPEAANLSPQALDGTSVRLNLLVADPDALAERAVAAGATLVAPVADQAYGLRQGRLADPYGHHWLIGTPLAGEAGDWARP